MILRHWQLFAALVWFGLAASLSLRSYWLPDELAARYTSQNFSLGVLAGVLFGVWNLVRWQQARSLTYHRRTAPTETRERPVKPVAAYEYLPEFDFHNVEQNKPQSDSSRDASPGA